MDVLLIDVPREFSLPESSWCLGYRYLIAALRRSAFSAAILHPPSIRGGNVRDRLIRRIVELNPSIVGFTTYDVQLASLLDLVDDLRAQGLRSHVTLGGLCASAIAEDLLAEHKSIDSVVFGEGEAAFVELAEQVIHRAGPFQIDGVCRRIGATAVRGAPRPLVDDLDSLAAPALDDFIDPAWSAPLQLTNGCVPVIASRGCYGRCSFCCIQKFYRSSPGRVWRPRGAAGVVDEIVRVTASTGCRGITFVDENFMGPGDLGRIHAAEIARELERRGLKIPFNFGCRANDIDRETIRILKHAGLAAVSLGIESMSPETLRLFNKGTTPEVNYRALAILEEMEIFTEITFIFFHPLSTLRQIRQNLQFIEHVNRAKYTYFNNQQPFSQFIPFFGTDLTALLVSRGLAERTTRRCQVQYEDPRVGFIAEAVGRVRSEGLLDLRALLPEGRSPELSSIREALRGHYVHLNAVRIPELVYQLCELFEAGADSGSPPVRAAAAQFEAEADRVDSLVGRFLAHVA